MLELCHLHPVVRFEQTSPIARIPFYFGRRRTYMVAVALIARVCPTKGLVRRTLAASGVYYLADGPDRLRSCSAFSGFQFYLWFTAVFSVDIDDGTVRGVDN